MKLFFIGLLLVCFSIGVQAQNLLSSKDLSTLKVDALTEAEITQIQAQLQQAGMTIDQVEQQAIAKGMSPSEFAKLKAKLGTAKGAKPNANSPLRKMTGKRGQNTYADSTGKERKERPENNINPLIYGSELFNDNGTGFGENQNIATPLNYEIGPNDVLKLVVYGVQEYSDDLTVSKEGFIQVQNVGQIKVAGLSIEAATDRLKNQMIRSAYPSIARGESKLALTLGDIRTIQVTVIGAARSGNYNISSLSNLLSALTEAGGPSEIGSYRAIELIRNNKIFKTIDLYHFMQNGDQSQNIGLKDHDVIRVPPYKNRVEIKGQIKRPGIFELVGKENFSQFLNYAGGFDDTAYTAVVKVIQKSDKEKSVKDLAKIDFEKYEPGGGDVFIVSKILDRFQNRVKLSGAVFRPDVYELSAGMRITDLVRRADGLKEDAFTGRAQLIRLKPNLLKELISINLNKALRNDATENILLQREDELYINSVWDLRDSLAVDLMGEVRNAGRYVYLDSMTVKDLILMSGGFNYAANKSVEVARMVQFENKVDNNRVSTIYKTEINGDLSFNVGHENIVLQPFDVVTITKKSGFTTPEIITVSGQVQNAGKYTLRTRVERVSDIVNRSGGLIGDAYGEGAFIKRSKHVVDTLKADETKTSIEEVYRRKLKAQQATEKADIQNQLGNTNSMADQNANKKNLADTINSILNDLNNDYYQIAIDINYIIAHPGSEDDLVLKDKDELVIPKVDNRIKISGGVLRPTNIVYREGLSINDCISAAGGISEYAKRGRAYVVYANGKSNRTKHFGFFRISPQIKPGCEVILPETNEKIEKPLTTILSFTTVIAQVIAALATVKLLTK
jgi:protein involved in polysaccharide export with SLBB domain